MHFSPTEYFNIPYIKNFLKVITNIYFQILIFCAKKTKNIFFFLNEVLTLKQKSIYLNVFNQILSRNIYVYISL